MMKAKAETVIIWLFLLFVTGSSLKLYFEEKANSTRLTYDLKAALETAVDFKTKNGQQASKMKAQELTISELRKINPAIISQLKNLYIPPRLAESYTELSQEMKAAVKAPIKDSIRYPIGINSDDREPEKIKVLQYWDQWISIHGVLDPDTAKIKVLATDTIFTAIHKGERRRPWLWVFSKRQLTTSATNRSPYISVHVINSGVIRK